MDSTPFFGRGPEMAWLADRLDRDARYLVIYGPARIGKTALLRHLVHHMVAHHSTRRYIAVYLDVGLVGTWSPESRLLEIAGQIGRSVREQTGLRLELPRAQTYASDAVQAWQDYLHSPYPAYLCALCHGGRESCRFHGFEARRRPHLPCGRHL